MGARESKREGNASKKTWKRVLKLVLLLVAALLVVLALVLFLRMRSFTSRQPAVTKVEIVLGDEAAMSARLSRALRFETISYEDADKSSAQAFRDLHDFVAESFPLVHERLKREAVGELSALYTWKGKNPARKPILLAAHLDVVPADATRWTHPPFSGAVADGFVWGRGALDDKGSAMAILEAVEELLRRDFVPEQTLYLAFGHDEEVGGYAGAKRIAELLASRKVELEATIDEGMVITEGILDGIERPVALIGASEKGYMDVELVATGTGGHSSMPPRQTAVGVLGRAIHRLQSSPIPGGIDGPAREMFEFIGPEFGFGQRLVMANLWLFGGLVESKMSKKHTTDAILRSTIAPTMLRGSEKSNVLPQVARAVVNVRVKPGDTRDSVLAHFRKAIDDSRVEVKALGHEPVEAQPSSSTRSRVFKTMMRTIRELDPEIVVAPGLMIAYTDSRHYASISEDIYRFLPIRYRSDDLPRLHGVDERISEEHYADMVRFYLHLIRSLQG